MSQAEHIRGQISKAYGEAVTNASGKACCGDLARVSACDIGYSEDDLAALPEGAAGASFGCGNPLALIDIGQGETILDLGSGAGLDILIAARRAGPGGRAIGIDMTDEMIATARKNIADAGADNVEVIKSVIEDIPLETGTVDLVISNCVINLSTDKNRVFAEISRLLRAGGRIQISDIVLEEDALPQWVREHRVLYDELYSSCIAGAISEAAYVQGLTRAGLVDVEVRERIMYDEDAIRGFVGNGEAPVNTPRAGNGSTVTERQLGELVSALAGKVWSARIFARKPAA